MRKRTLNRAWIRPKVDAEDWKKAHGATVDNVKAKAEQWASDHKDKIDAAKDKLEDWKDKHLSN